jgi:integrase
MAKPRGMYLRNGIWHARKDVPKPLREIIGKTSLQKTLGTSDLATAKIRFHGVMQGFEATIADAWRTLKQEPRASEQPKPFVVEVKYPDWLNASDFPPVDLRTPDQKIADMLIKANLLPEKKDPIQMSTVFEQWKAEKQPQMNTAAEYQRSLQVFMEVCGTQPVADYTKEHARKWKDRVVAIPDLAHSTREKWFGAIRTLFRFADRQDYLIVDPFAKITLERPNRVKASRREGWDIEDLQKLFASPVFTEGHRPKAAAGEGAYWIPVLALYHGFRLGELCQLRRTDLIPKNGIPCLEVRPSDEDDEGPAKSVKNEESIRRVPLHHTVIKLGFLDYTKTLKGEQMFPLIRPDTRGRWSGYYSKWFGRYRRSIGLDRRWIDFHSFRHSWKTAARAAKIPPEYHNEITGHDDQSIGSTYGNVPIPELKEELDKVRFDVSIPKWSP